MESTIKWTIQGTRGEVRYPVQEFDTKKKAVSAVKSQMQPKTPIVRDGHHYSFTAAQ